MSPDEAEPADLEVGSAEEEEFGKVGGVGKVVAKCVDSECELRERCTTGFMIGIGFRAGELSVRCAGLTHTALYYVMEVAKILFKKGIIVCANSPLCVVFLTTVLKPTQLCEM